MAIRASTPAVNGVVIAPLIRRGQPAEHGLPHEEVLLVAGREHDDHPDDGQRAG